MLALASTQRSFSSAASPAPLRGRAKLGEKMEALLSAVPGPDDPEAAAKVERWLLGKRNVVVLSGAGLSTDSGIPDYRGVNGSYRSGHAPMTHQEFAKSEANRRRYWARALAGFPTFAAARPNAGHAAIAALQDRGVVGTIITQNVDGLHEKAGARRVVPLHGRGDRVRCLGCGAESCRRAFHARIAARNPEARARPAVARDDAALRPDGDADGAAPLDVVPSCEACGGVVKPDVVFFGDTVPKATVDACFAALRDADGLLCCGTSLAVFSALRFVRRAAEDGVPICVLNRGPTRADVEGLPVAPVRAGVAETLAEVAARPL